MLFGFDWIGDGLDGGLFFDFFDWKFVGVVLGVVDGKVVGWFGDWDWLFFFRGDY